MSATGTCLNCGKKIGPLFMRPTPDFPRPDVPARSGSLHRMDPKGYFCTLRCAARYGVRAATPADATNQGATHG